MFREKFILILVLTFVLETAALIGILLLSHVYSQDGFSFWFWHIWLRSLIVAFGLDFGLVFYYGWDYLNPTETRLPVYLGLGAALVVGLIIKGVSILF